MPEAVEGYRLSPTQRRIWALQSADDGGPYAAWAALEIEGPVDPSRLEEALRRCARRHEILRTRFVCPEPATVPVQVIAEDPAVDFERIDGGSEPVAPPLRLPAGRARKPRVPARLVRLAPERHRLEIELPSLLADAESLAHLVAELVRDYGELAGEASSAGGAEPELQYADVAEWLNGLLEEDAGGEAGADEGRRYWRRLELPRRLAAEPALGEERPAPSRTFRPRAVDRVIDPGLRVGIDELAAGHGVSVEIVLLAAYLLVLDRSTLDGEPLLWAAFRGRGFQELEGAVGPLARHLPIPCPIAEHDGLADVLGRLVPAVEAAEEWLESFSWEDELGREEASPRPRYGFEHRPRIPGSTADGVRFAIEDHHATLEPFTLQLVCTERLDGTLRARFVHDAERLDAGAAERLADRFRTVLAELVAAPATPRDRLRLIGEAERRTLLERAGTSGPIPDRPLFELIDEQARRTPEHAALVDEHHELSYARMRRRSDALARRLRATGVGSEARVALCLGRSVDAVVSMLAVHKAGGAYVPLDPELPEERLAFMLADSGAAVVLTSGGLEERLGTLPPSVRVIDVDAVREQDEEAGSSPGSSPAIEGSGVGLDGLAYVIYTSGSTGVPKGIAIGHRQLAAYAAGVAERLDLPAAGAYAMVSTLAADLGNTVIFPALCRGATLHLVAEHRTTDPEAWTELVARRPIDVLKIVPSHLRLLLEGSDPAAALPRQRLILGGETCDWRLVERVFELAPGCRVFNHYGPTETTVGVLAQEIVRGAPRSIAPPLGEPLPNSRIHLLDDRLEPVPLGCAGELQVSGAGLARGYLGGAARTAERFVPDPWSPEPGGRLYRTGDRVRRHPDGYLFLGRQDDQVKIRGVRIEPGEVERVLAEAPGVADAVVVARADAAGQLRLVAYVVPGGTAPTSAELRRWLLAKVPEPFVPSLFVTLDSVPLTPNGKVDRHALPAPEEGQADSHRAGPRSPVEVQLLQIWEDVLETGPLGVTDDFFAVGGNSFLAVRLMARIRSQLGRRFPLATLLSASTVRRLAERLAEGETGRPEHLVAIQPHGTRPPLYCAHPGHGSVICYLELAHHLGRDQPLFGFQALDFDLDLDPHVSLETMASRYVEALVETRPEGPYRLAGWSFGGAVAFEMARQLVEGGREVELLVLFDCRLPITAPLLTSLEPSLMRATLLFDHLTDRPEDGGVSPRDLVGLSLEEQLELFSRRLGAVPEDLVPEDLPGDLLDRYVEARMARIDALRHYVFRPYSGRIVLFRATEPTPNVPLEEMRRVFEQAARSKDYGWSEISPRVDVLEVPGTHGSMIDAPHVAELSRRLLEVIEALRPHEVAT